MYISKQVLSETGEVVYVYPKTTKDGNNGTICIKNKKYIPKPKDQHLKRGPKRPHGPNGPHINCKSKYQYTQEEVDLIKDLYKQYDNYNRVIRILKEEYNIVITQSLIRRVLSNDNKRYIKNID